MTVNVEKEINDRREEIDRLTRTISEQRKVIETEIDALGAEKNAAAREMRAGEVLHAVRKLENNYESLIAARTRLEIWLTTNSLMESRT